MEKIIMHIDVNSAFLSWTAVDLLKNGYKKDIRCECSVIGGDESKRKGIVLAKSTLAKNKGINTAETLYQARSKCRNLKIYRPNYALYDKMSHAFFTLLKKYTNDIEILSIDECFLDYGKVKKMYGDEVIFANKLKNEIYKTLGFTVNIGIANNKLCAKMASDFSKPNKIHTLYDYEIKEKMWPLPIENLYGIGKKSTEKLINLNIKTIKDLATCNKEIIYPYFKNQTDYIIKIANGIDDSDVLSEKKDPKCISTTTTLLYDYDDIAEINKELKTISEKISNELKEKSVYTSRVAVIIKDKYFKTTSHQNKLPNPTNSLNEIYEMSKKIFKEYWDETPVRLIGIRVDAFSSSKDYQISLFEDVKKKESDEIVDALIDSLIKKYGDKIIKK